MDILAATTASRDVQHPRQIQRGTEILAAAGEANNRISGLDISPEDIALLEKWIDEDVPQEEQTRRLVVVCIGGDTTAEKVENLARYYKVKPSNGYPKRLADPLIRIEGVEGDDTVSLIADLFREGMLSTEQANALTLARERSK